MHMRDEIVGDAAFQEKDGDVINQREGTGNGKWKKFTNI